MKHEALEKNIGLMIGFILFAISFGVLVELVPLFFLKSTTEPIAGLKPLPALVLEGRDIYIREGCVSCHSQLVRPIRSETERYGEFSKSGEFVYDHPFLWGSKRTGPDLHREGGKYPDSWHYQSCHEKLAFYFHQKGMDQEYKWHHTFLLHPVSRLQDNQILYLFHRQFFSYSQNYHLDIW